MGIGTTLAWPVGTEGLGNEGVASLVQRTRAAIGYVAYAYAREHHLSDVALPSHDGPVVRAGRGVRGGARRRAWHAVADLAGGLTNEPGARSWPIVGASYVLVRPGRRRRRARGRVLRLGLARARGIANDLGYVALPADVVARPSGRR